MIKVDLNLQSPTLEHLEMIIEASSSRQCRDRLFFVDAYAYEGKKPAEIQVLLRERPLVVRGQVTNKTFNEVSLGSLLPLAIPIEVSGRYRIHTAYIFLIWPLDGNDVYPIALRTLANNCKSVNPRRGGWISERINVLSMDAHIPPYSSDRVAWAETIGLPGCASDASFPASLMKYSLVVGSGWFMDWQPAGPAGLGVCIEVTVGSQWIFISRPKATYGGRFEADEKTGNWGTKEALSDVLLVAGSCM